MSRPFAPAELGSVGAALLPVARTLEEYASRATAVPRADLADRILRSLAREQAPTPPVLLVRAVRNRSAHATARYLALSVQAALGVRRTFPLAVRAQATAVVLTAAIVLGGGGAALAVGAAGVVQVLVPELSTRPAPAVQHPHSGSHGPSHGKGIRSHGPKSDKATSPTKSPHKRGPGAIDARGSERGASNSSAQAKPSRATGTASED